MHDPTTPSSGHDPILPPGTSQSDATPPLSHEVRQRYAIEAVLGEGGMGTVYRAFDRRLNRVVALKVLRADALTPEGRARFQTEAKAVAALDHPHVVKIHDVGEVLLPDGRSASPHLALEYVPGGSLAEALRARKLRGPNGVRESAHLIAVLAKAIHHAHKRGVVHRDLKPGNVLLAERSDVAGLNTAVGVPKITDFGLARQLSAEQRHTQPGVVMGTPAYMAPEQAEGRKDVGPAADTWALGVMLYECLTGQVPFRAASMAELLYRICQAEPQAPREVRGEVPADLEEICLACLAKAPGQRPSAKELCRRLARFLNEPRQEGLASGKPGSQAETKAPARTTPTNRGRGASPRLRLVAGIVVLVGIGVTLLRPWEGNKPTTQSMATKEGKVRGMPNEHVVMLPGGVTLKVVRIPGTKETYPDKGTFTMGSPLGEVKRLVEEEDQHEVEITEFYLGKYEVTQGQFRAVMGYNPSFFSNNSSRRPGMKYPGNARPGGGQEKVQELDTEDFPVENVMYEEAKAFVTKLNELDPKRPQGFVYRLPREAEWEYACRGGALEYQRFHFGNSLSPKQANIANNLGRTTSVGSYGANSFGLHDMHGNVWEWCDDWYAADYYATSPRRDPPGPLQGSSRVARGGSCTLWAYGCLSARRHSYPPDTRRTVLGFRVAVGR